MGRYDALLSGQKAEDQEANVIQLINTTITDPRPDLTEDSVLWSRLLALAKEETEQLKGKTTVEQDRTGDFFKVLHGFRGAGTRLKKSDSGKYVLRPDIDPTGKQAWMSQQEYEQFRDRYLKPWKDVLVRVLEKLSASVVIR